MLIFILLLNFWLVDLPSQDLTTLQQHSSLNDDLQEYSLISTYHSDQHAILVKINLKLNSEVGFELWDTKEIKPLKIWRPQMAAIGEYRTVLHIPDISQGTYLMKAHIDKEVLEQAVFVY